MDCCCICEIIVDFILKLQEPIALFTLALVIFAGLQYYVQKNSHTLNLFNKRWQALRDLQEIGKTAQTWKHIYYKDSPTSEESYWVMYHKINLFANECEILFDKNIFEIGQKTAESFKEYHHVLDQLEDWEKYHKEYPEQYTEERKSNLFGLKVNLNSQIMGLFDDWYEKILDFIKHRKIS